MPKRLKTNFTLLGLLGVLLLGALDCFAQANTLAERFRSGINFFQQGQFEQAFHEFSSLRRECQQCAADSDLELWYTRASIAIQHPESERALRDFLQKHPSHPERESLIRQLADELYVQGTLNSYERAYRYYSELSPEVDPQNEAAARLAFRYAVSALESRHDNLTSSNPKNNPLLFFKNVKMADYEDSWEARYFYGFLVLNSNHRKFRDTDIQKEAINDLKQYLTHMGTDRRLHPMYQSAEDMLLKHWMKNGKEDEIEGWLGRYDGDDLPSSESFFLYQAQKAHAAEDFGKMTRYLESAMKINKNNQKNDSLTLVLGYGKALEKAYQDAINWWTPTSIEGTSQGRTALFNIGLAQLRLGNKEEALIAFEKVGASNDTDLRDVKVSSLRLAVQLHLELGNLSEAEKYATIYKNSYPDQRDADNLMLGNAEKIAATGNWQGARQQLLRMVKDGRFSADQKAFLQKNYLHEGKVTYRKESYSQAIAALERSLTYNQNPQVANETYFWLGAAYLERGLPRDLEKGLFFLQEKLIPNSLEDIQAAYLVGYVHFNESNYREGYKYFQRAATRGNGLDENHRLDAQMRQADCALETGRVEEAIRKYESLYDPMPHRRAYINFRLGRFAFTNGKYPKAEELFRKIVREFPSSSEVPAALFMLGLCHEAQRQPALAQTSYQKIIEGFPNHPYYTKALFQRGELTQRTGNTNVAIKSYTKLINDHPAHPLAVESMRALRNLSAEGAIIPRLEILQAQVDK
ncbi:MAG: tetratricopeptide repeat protein, partial [Bacteroidota bacterium]